MKWRNKLLINQALLYDFNGILMRLPVVLFLTLRNFDKKII